MKIEVDILDHTRVAVTHTPSTAHRVLYGSRANTRFAVRHASTWTWDDDGRLVDQRSLLLIEHALQVAPAVSVTT